MQSFKKERMIQILTQEINTMIIMGKINDPRVSTRVSVLYVKLGKDFTSAVVYISSFLNDDVLERTVSALNHAKGHVQREIAKKHNWKNTPKLVFKASDGLKHGERVREALETKHEHSPLDDEESSTDNL